MPATHVDAPLVAEWLHVAGDGPELVYVPGIDGSGELLLGTRDRLERDFRLGCLHYRFEGPGDPAGAYAALARTIVARLDDGGFTRPLVLAESFGVAVALRLALDAPGRVRGLALVNGFARFPSPWKLGVSRRFAALLPPLAFRLGRNLVAQPTLFAPRRDPEVLRAFRGLERLRMDAGYRFRMAMIQRVDLTGELGRLDLPVDVFASDRDRVVPPTCGHDLAASIRGARLHELERSGHLVLPFEPDRWAARLADLDER